MEEIHRVFGELELFSKKRFGFNKRGTPVYLFRPLDTSMPEAKVASKCAKIYGTQKNVYARVVYSNLEEGGRQNLCSIIGHVDDSEAIRLMLLNKWLGNIKTGNKRFNLTDQQQFSPAQEAAPPAEYEADYICTIDPVDCVDMDDALSIYRCEEGVTLSAHITDVDDYIPCDSELDAIFKRQPLTIYHGGGETCRPTHALPETLSTDLCSLVAGQRRTVLTVSFLISEDAIKRVDLGRHRIVSVAKLTYEEANQQIGSKIQNPLKDMADLVERHFPKVENSASDDPAHALVERMMIACGKVVAGRLLECSGELPCLVRKHTNNKTSTSKIRSAAEYVLVRPSEHGKIHPHEGMGLECYMHFTSPIRRYADLVVHRQVKRRLLSLDTRENALEQGDVDALNRFQIGCRRYEAQWNLWSHHLLPLPVGGKTLVEFEPGEFYREKDGGVWITGYVTQFSRFIGVPILDARIAESAKIVNENSLVIEKNGNCHTALAFDTQTAQVEIWWERGRGLRGLRSRMIQPPINMMSEIEK
jgi:exoribonuclease R